MVARVRSLTWILTFVALFGCGQRSDVDISNTVADVLPATASSKDFGDYIVYFNSMNTDQLSDKIAADYGIVRSKNRALLNVSIHRKQPNAQPVAVEGTVTASAVNLMGQLKDMTLRKVPEGDAIYYIGELAVNDGEVVIYTVDITPANESERLTLRFQKQFFVED
jgi:hypothetical protein